MVQIQTDQPGYETPFKMPPQAFRGDSFKALILNQKAGESTFHRLWGCLQLLNILPQFIFPTKNKTHPPLCPFAASWLSRLLQRLFAWESVRSWSVMSSAYCRSQHSAERVSQKAQFEHHLQHRSSIESVRRWICNSEASFQLSQLFSAVSSNVGSAAVKGKTSAFHKVTQYV